MSQIQLVISMDEAGAVSVNGPLNNKVLCYGLLATAQDVIKDMNDQQAKKIVAPTNGDVLSLARH